jgi:hypothetical protein
MCRAKVLITHACPSISVLEGSSAFINHLGRFHCVIGKLGYRVASLEVTPERRIVQ